MEVLRNNREILITLLEAFVYDPLLEWNVEHLEKFFFSFFFIYFINEFQKMDQHFFFFKKKKRENKEIELNISLGIIASRIVEIKVFILNFFFSKKKMIRNQYSQ